MSFATIVGGRWSGRCGQIRRQDGRMFVIDLDDDGEHYAAEVRVDRRHVYRNRGVMRGTNVPGPGTEWGRGRTAS